MAGDAAAADDGQFPGVWGLEVERPALAREPRHAKRRVKFRARWCCGAVVRA